MKATLKIFLLLPALFLSLTTFAQTNLGFKLGLQNSGVISDLQFGDYQPTKFIASPQVVFLGLTAWAAPGQVPQPGWAIVHHGARAAIERCVVYNVRGAGIVSELGNEIGQWIDNVVAWARGDGFAFDWGFRLEQNQNHNGHANYDGQNES